MKYLVMMLLLAACNDNKVTPTDVEFARCVCKKKSYKLYYVERMGRSLLIACAVEERTYMFLDESYTEGCSK